MSQAPATVTSLQTAMERARKRQRAALIGYFPVGYPDVTTSIEVMTAMAAGGCDVIEVGIPHADAMLDGPVISTATAAALRRGTRIGHALTAVRRISETAACPIAMSYWQPLARYGAEQFAADLAAAGGSACVVPDLPVEEFHRWAPAARWHGIPSVFIVSPDTSDARLDRICQASSGIVYAAASRGLTGSLRGPDGDLEAFIARIRARTDLPICAGIGVGTAAHVRRIAAVCDGVVVGSAFVRCVAAASARTAAAARDLAGRFAAAAERRPAEPSTSHDQDGADGHPVRRPRQIRS